MATVRVREPLKKLAGGTSDHAIDGDTVAELLAEFERTYPEVSGWILDERGHIRRHINVFVNGEPGAGDTTVQASDRVDILPAISGG